MTIRPRRWLVAALALTAMGLASGCAATAVRPWDRDLLADPKMKFRPSPMMSAVARFAFSRGASRRITMPSRNTSPPTIR